MFHSMQSCKRVQLSDLKTKRLLLYVQNGRPASGVVLFSHLAQELTIKTTVQKVQHLFAVVLHR